LGYEAPLVSKIGINETGVITQKPKTFIFCSIYSILTLLQTQGRTEKDRKSGSKRECLWIIKAFPNGNEWGSSQSVREVKEIED